MQIFFYIVLAILVLLLMITVHEFGHYIAGKLLGFKIDEFSIGFGKAIYSKTNKKTGEKFSIRIFPIGGYCLFHGEDENEKKEREAASAKLQEGEVLQSQSVAPIAVKTQHFNAQKPWKRLIVLFSGAFFNFIFALLFTMLMLGTVGFDRIKIDKVLEGPNSGKLQKGDIILKVDDQKVSVMGGNFFQVLLAKHEIGDTDITLTVKRDGKIVKIDNIEMSPDPDDAQAGLIGFVPTGYKHSFGEAIGRSFEVSVGIAGEVLKAFGQLITFQLSVKEVSGPVGTVGAIATTAMQNISAILVLIPLVSINLAVFNLLPLPALDGGRMAFVAIEWVARKPVKREIEAMIHFIGIIALFALVLLLDFLHIIFK